MKKISSSKFAWENYGGRHYHLLKIFEPETYFLNKNYGIVGWCKGTELQVKPSSEYDAMMFYDKKTGEEFWLHIPKEIIIRRK